MYGAGFKSPQDPNILPELVSPLRSVEIFRLGLGAFFSRLGGVLAVTHRGVC